MTEPDDLVDLLRTNGYQVFTLQPGESALEFITRVASQIPDHEST
jgi:hypothetical protein